MHPDGVAEVVKTTLREDLSTSLEPHGLTELNASVLGQQIGGQAAESSQHSPTPMHHLSFTVGSKGGGVSTQSSRVLAVVTRQLISQVSRDAGIRAGTQPFVVVRATPGGKLVTGISQHGGRLRGELGHVGKG